MEANFAGFAINPTKCSQLSLEEKRELVYEISVWADNASEILQTWSRRELLQIICAEMGKERKYTGVAKPKMIAHLLKLVSERKMTNHTDVMPMPHNLLESMENHSGVRKKRKKGNLSQSLNDNLPRNDVDQPDDTVDTMVCQNLACQAPLFLGDTFCRKCSCCICYCYDHNKDPSLWIFCNSNPPYNTKSCGMSCHLQCALKYEKTWGVRNGSYVKLDGYFHCFLCGKVNRLMGSWREQLSLATCAKTIDQLCTRMFLCCKILKGGSEQYKPLRDIVMTVAKKVKNEVGSLDRLSAKMAGQSVKRLSCGIQVHDLLALATEEADSLLNSKKVLAAMASTQPPKSQGKTICQIQSVKDADAGITSHCIKRCYSNMSLQSSDSIHHHVHWQEFIKEAGDKKEEHVRPLFVQPDHSQRDGGGGDGQGCGGSTNSSDNNERVSPVEAFHDDMPFVCSNSDHLDTPIKSEYTPYGLPDSVDKKELTEREYEYCVKVIRWLECEGHMETDFRVKLLTWFSLKATMQERRIVKAFIDVLIDEPESLVDQLIDAFTDGICNKEKPTLSVGFCNRPWH